MIKGITTIRQLASAKDFQSLSDLLDALGFERGGDWKAAKSRGQYFLAPLGKIEIVAGRERFPSDIWVEVSDLDSARELLKREDQADRRYQGNRLGLAGAGSRAGPGA